MTACPPESISPRNNAASVPIAARSPSSKVTLVSVTSLTASSRLPSHSPARFPTSADDFGSASMRCTSATTAAPSCSAPAAARASSASSGMLLQRKYERRDATS